MLIKKSQSKKIANSDQCTVWEYAFKSDIISFATTYIDGRYPDEGKVYNSKCEEIYFVAGGAGTVHSEFGDYKLEEGDLYHFKMGETYWTEGKKLQLILVNAPKWSPDQHKHLK